MSVVNVVKWMYSQSVLIECLCDGDLNSQVASWVRESFTLSELQGVYERGNSND